MNCSNCGAPLVTGAPRCVKCGSAAPTTVAPQQSGFFDTVTQSVSKLTQAHPHTAGQTQVVAGSKSKVVYYLLGFFLGALGAHKFYLGFHKKAIKQLVLAFFLAAFFSGFFSALGDRQEPKDLWWSVSAIWAFVDMYRFMKSNMPLDADGRPVV